MLFAWDEDVRPSGVVVNIACPSQVVENKRYVSADFWSAVRARLKAKHGDDFHVLGLASAAGDQSPRDLVRRGRGEKDMRDESGLEEMGARIAEAVERALPKAAAGIRTGVPFRHVVESLNLPRRKVTKEEAEEMTAMADELAADNPPPDTVNGGKVRRYRAAAALYENQQKGETIEPFTMELHAVRIGDMALATNPFELFLDYGLQMKSRSKALQTFVVQLACARGGYLPTEKAVRHGGYGAMINNGPVGPEGGKVLVDRTVEVINAMWAEV
jgi:hypothetical protein